MLLALLDADHVEHASAWEWLDADIASGWASCAITENGFVRVITQPRYPSPVPTAQALDLLAGAREGGDHEFWSCDVSLLDRGVVDASRLLGPRQVTDAYLLALAVSRGGRFVTFDRGLSLAAVPGAGEEHLTVL